MKIFLDVGAYRGESAEQALGLNYYDVVCSFEPSKFNVDIIKKKTTLQTDKFRIYDFGLWNETGSTLFYHDGTTGGTVFEDKGYFASEENKKRGDEIELCEFRKASDFVKKLSMNDEIIMKLNCEGTECDIIDDLFDTEEIIKLAGIGVDFDCRKIPSQIGRRQETIIRLVQYGMPFIDMTCIEVPKRVQLLTRAFGKEYNENFNATQTA